MQPVQLVRASDLALDLERRSLTVAGRALELTPIEFDLLALFLRHPGQVFTRLKLLDQLGDASYAGDERAIDQHIKNLRTKLDDDAHNPRYIATVHGVGYRFIGGESADA